MKDKTQAIVWIIPQGAVVPSGFPLTVRVFTTIKEFLSELSTLSDDAEVAVQLSEQQLELLVTLEPHLGYDARVIRGFPEEAVTGQWQLWASRYDVIPLEAIMETRAMSGDRRDAPDTEGSETETTASKEVRLLNLPKNNVDRQRARGAEADKRGVSIEDLDDTQTEV